MFNLLPWNVQNAFLEAGCPLLKLLEPFSWSHSLKSQGSAKAWFKMEDDGSTLQDDWRHHE